MAVARSFRDLNTYGMAREGAKGIFELTRRFPAEERYALTDQIRRSSRAVKAILAEGWARRRYKAAFINKIDKALGEAMETQSWLDDAFDCDYIDQTVHSSMDQLYQQIGAKLAAMINRADDFCKHPSDHNYMQEETGSYATEVGDL